MKHVRLSLSLLLLAAVVSVGYFQSVEANAPGGGVCNCMTPNTGKYGTKQPTDTTCPEDNCYINLP